MGAPKDILGTMRPSWMEKWSYWAPPVTAASRSDPSSRKLALATEGEIIMSLVLIPMGISASEGTLTHAIVVTTDATKWFALIARANGVVLCNVPPVDVR